MLSVYMQEVNLKHFIIFNLFYLRFSFGPHICIGNCSFRICGGSVRNITSLHTHTHTHHTATLYTQLLSSHHSLVSDNFSLFTPFPSHTPYRHEPRNTYVCSVLFQHTDMGHHFQYVFHEGESRIST